jgi:hypothetical protein
VTAYPGFSNDDDFCGIHFDLPGTGRAAYTRAPVGLQPSFATPALEDPVAVDDHVSVPHVPAVSPTDYPGHEGIELTEGRDWYEMIHVVPRAIDFGNILATIEEEFELYNAYRLQNVSLTSFTNAVDPGSDVTDLPTLPHTIGAQNGLVLTAETTLTDDPNFAGNLVFGFDVGNAYLYIEGVRLILWYFAPESPVREALEWLTDMFAARGGSEKRSSPRESPRQIISHRYRLDGQERRQARMYLMDWQSQLFGLPTWRDQVILTADVAAAAFTINVTTTLYSDFRVGGQAVVLTDRDTFDALVIQSKTSTSITFSTALQNSYDAGTLVMPIRQAQIADLVNADQFPKNLEDFEAVWEVQDNDVDIADTSAFSSYDGKVLLDDCNPVVRSVAESFRTKVSVIDGKAGLREYNGRWPNMKRGHSQGFIARTRQGVWEMRQLFYALRGRQISFYTLTWTPDLVVTGTLTAAQSLMDIENIGYSRFAQERNPMKHIHLLFTDGTSVLREITNSVVVDSDTERLTVDTAWATTKLASEVSRVSFIELVRFATDRVEIEYDRPDFARTRVPVVSLIEAS